MSKKLENNGLWESSRMMLPEHREAFMAMQKAAEKRAKPMLHDDEYEVMIRCIKESYYTQKTIVVELFHEYEAEYVSGRVTRIDEQMRHIRLDRSDEHTWVAVEQIVQVRNLVQ
jgi:hypothetical protein